MDVQEWKSGCGHFLEGFPETGNEEQIMYNYKISFQYDENKVLKMTSTIFQKSIGTSLKDAVVILIKYTDQVIILEYQIRVFCFCPYQLFVRMLSFVPNKFLFPTCETFFS